MMALLVVEDDIQFGDVREAALAGDERVAVLAGRRRDERAASGERRPVAVESTV